MATTRKILLPATLLATALSPLAGSAWGQEVAFPANTQPVVAPQAKPGAAIPVTAPTSASPPGVAGQSATPAGTTVPEIAPQRQEPPRVPAKVAFAQGKLEITASNSSLNSILRGISKATGMKITGGVTEERVYGHYGPDASAKVLADLLQGTGFNFLLRERAPNQPAELVLTPQKGSVTPPGPFAKVYDDEPVTIDGNTSASIQKVAPPPSTLDIKPPMPGTPSPVWIAPVSTAGNPGTPGGTPTTLKTPEQVLEALKRMDAAQQAQQQKQAQTQQTPDQKKQSAQQ